MDLSSKAELGQRAEKIARQTLPFPRLRVVDPEPTVDVYLFDQGAVGLMKDCSLIDFADQIVSIKEPLSLFDNLGKLCLLDRHGFPHWLAESVSPALRSEVVASPPLSLLALKLVNHGSSFTQIQCIAKRGPFR